MPTFRYSAYRATGGETAGVLEAESLREATARLRQQGLFPREVSPLEGKRGRSLLRRGVATAELSLLTRRLATLSASAVPVYEALTALYEQEQPGELKQALSRVRGRLSEGAGLAGAMAAEPAIFSESYVSMVAAGEASGALDTVLERLADFLENQDRVRTRVTAALAYPILMTVVGSGVMLFLLTAVIPRIVTIFRDSKATLPLITRAVIGASGFLRGWWWALVLLAVGGWLLYRRLMETEDFRLKRDRLLLRLPVAGALWKRLILSRFAGVLSLLLSSGVPVMRALEITGEVVVNREYRLFCRSLREKVSEGSGIAPALAATHLFPPLLVHMVGVGEKGGELEKMLEKAGRAFEGEFDASLTRGMALLEPLLVLAMGVCVGTVVIAVLLPIFELNELIR